jgi:hypothetical protein
MKFVLVLTLLSMPVLSFAYCNPSYGAQAFQACMNEDSRQQAQYLYQQRMQQIQQQQLEQMQQQTEMMRQQQQQAAYSTYEQ